MDRSIIEADPPHFPREPASPLEIGPHLFKPSRLLIAP